MQCLQCHHMNPEGAAFCARCGAQLGTSLLASPLAGSPLAGSPAAPLEVVARLSPGYALQGRWLVEAELGDGGMSAVYQVYDAQTGERAALKVLRPERLGSWKARERMAREARALARIRHPNVVAIQEVLEHGSTLALVLELVSGGDLAGRCADGPLPVPEVVRLVDGILAGLAAIHAAGLVHRDLKPGNVLLTSDGTPKVADLGIARDPEAQPITEPGSVLGTPEYMSPEQIRGVEVGPAADLYACGVVLFEALSGRLPFEGSRDRDLLVAHLNQAPDLSRLPATISPALRKVVATALAKAPEQRYPSAAAMRGALAAASGVPLVASAPPQVSEPGPSARSSSDRQRLGEYLVVRLLGEGGMGRVYEAEERLSARRVALKVLRADVGRVPAARRLFLDEMAILARLDHPNIVRSLACIEADGELALVMEFLEGQTLRERLAAGRLPWAGAVDVALQIAAALECAHSLVPPVVHRDLKPENVMLLPNGGVKVMDFGIAKALDAVSRTATLTVGTLQYQSPEQIDARPIDARSDLYGLGLVLYEMLAGGPPFVAASQRELLNLQCTAPPPELPREVLLDLPRGVRRVLEQLLAKAPDERPASARAVISALEPFAGEGAELRRAAVTPASAMTPSTRAASEVRPAPRAGLVVPTPIAIAIVIGLSLFAGAITLIFRLLERFVP